MEVGEDAERRLLHWEDLGLTGGYGTIHLSDASTHALRDLSVALRGRRNVNNVFGEGQSPRMRQIREALDDLGIESNLLLQHSTPRRVYALKLGDDALESLSSNRHSTSRLISFDAIARGWTLRWLARRLDHLPALERVATEGPSSVQADLRPRDDRQPLLPGVSSSAPNVPRPRPPPGGVVVKAQASNVELVRSLYRATGACSDHHDAKTIRALHIPTAVDDFLRERAKRGGAIFVTGNPGDGKTHLLRHLEADLRASKVETILDANEEDDAVLRRRIDAALRKPGSGVAIAINEGVLVNLLSNAGDRPAAWIEEARDQLLRPFVFSGDAVRDPKANVCVVDLNLRNNLAGDVVRRALRTLLENLAPCAGCPGGPRCASQGNAVRLQQVSDRVVALLEVAGSAGFHATMRDLQGYLSFLIFGPTTCALAKGGGAAAPYWINAFEGGRGALFDELRRFDPMAQTAPLLDDLLWRRADAPADWAAGLDEPIVDPTSERVSQFVSRKRRALFEHRQGATILRAGEIGVDATFKTVLDGGGQALRTLIRLINRFFDRDEQTRDLLYLWVTHRYDAHPSRYAAASVAVPSTELEVVIPQLRPEVRPAFKDYRPSFAILRAKGSPAATGLRVDRALLNALTAGERGLPSTFRRGEPEARLAGFFDRLARGRVVDDGQVEVRLVDMDDGRNLQVAIDVERRRYVPR